MSDPPGNRNLMEPDPDVDVDYGAVLRVILWVIVYALIIALVAVHWAHRG